ncbi:hypothetical protein [Streptomyces viridosporus]|uniref:hypothetical protein n=1 Tax=Streptomyces viridosporus TaxID=67581 RepID=UPI0036F80228
MLLRPAHLGRANAFALLRLLPMSDRDTDVEILALRHQLSVPERRLGEEKVRFQPERPGVPGGAAVPAAVGGATQAAAAGPDE